MAVKGIPYFPLDCQLDDKFALIEAEYGLTGFAVVVKLFQRIYGRCGYYCEYTNEVALLFSKEIGLGCNAVSEIVSAAIRRGIFDKKLYDEYHILTSVGIQERYFEAVSRRKKVEIKNEYLLLKCDQLPKNADIFEKNADISSKNADIFEQSKVKKSKVKKSKVNVCPRGTYGHVNLTEQEYDDLCKLYLKDTVNQYVERVDAYLHNHPNIKGYDSHYQTVLDWLEKDGVDKKSNHSYDVEMMFERAMSMSPFDKVVSGK